MMTTKRVSTKVKLIELVRGKTLLREAPTERDAILSIYNFDVDRIKTMPQYGMNYDLIYKKYTKDECEVYAKEFRDRYHTQRNFKSLLRRGRKLGLDFYMVEDENKVKGL